MPPVSRMCVVASLLLSVGACSARFQANARTSTSSGSTSNASATSNANSNTTSNVNSNATLRAQGSLNVRGGGAGTGNAQQVSPPPAPPRDAQVTATVTTAARTVTYTAPPRPEIRPAQRPVVFRGRVMGASRRAGRARGSVVAPPPVVTTPTTVTAPPTATPPVAPPVVVATPEPAPPAAPIPAPTTPPENVFGYDRPVLGCFEGQVYFIPDNSQRLPRNYADLESSAVLYACEWDIPTRAWEQGFPGLSERFEWFAIRYEGAFNIATAGKYRFRLSSDDGAKVTIDGRVVIDNDGVHPPQEKSGEATLSAGDHTMVIEYFQGPRYHINLQLFVTPPDGQEGVFSVRPQ